MDICWNARIKNNGCQIWFVSEIMWAKFLQNLQKVFKVLSGPNWEYHSTLKTGIEEQYRKLIIGYKVLLNKTEAISHYLTKSNPICTLVEILEILMIQQTGDLSWFNKLIINLSTHIRSIIKVFFPNNFWPFFIVIENKIRQRLNKERLKHEFKGFFEKAYKIKTAATIPRLSRLIHDNPFLDLTWTQFYKHGWLKNPKNPYLQNI